MEVIASFLGVILILLAFLTYRHANFFKSNNVPYYPSIPFLGVFFDVVLGRTGFYELTSALYNNPKFKDQPFMGIFAFHKHALFIKDPELIKNILVKDFNNFSNHHLGSDTHDPLGSSTVFAVKDPYWKILRRKLSPQFSSGKIKLMFPLIKKVGDDLTEFIETKIENGCVEVDAKHLATYFTTDVVASTAFSVEASSMKDSNSEFFMNAKKLFEYSLHRTFELGAFFLLPEVTKTLNFHFFTKDASEFLIKTLDVIVADREASGIKRHDLIDTIVEIKKSGLSEDPDHPLKMEMLYAQAAVFFSAGSETSSSVISFVLYEMAKNQDIQNKVREEIKSMLRNSDGKFTYEGVVSDTPYLMQVIEETLRLYPLLPLIDRECSNPNGYSLQPFSDFKIPYRMPIYIPAYGLHMDEKYYPNPTKFDPDRFSVETKRNLNPFTYLPFGNGPRNCIGERLGLIQTKIALIKILQKFRVDVTENTPKVIRFNRKGFVAQSDEKVAIKLVKDEIVF